MVTEWLTVLKVFTVYINTECKFQVNIMTVDKRFESDQSVTFISFRRIYIRCNLTKRDVPVIRKLIFITKDVASL